MEKVKVLAFVLFLIAISKSDNSCQNFNDIYKDAKLLVRDRRDHEKRLQDKGYVLSASDIEFKRSRQGLTCNTTNYWFSSEGETADNLNTAARLMSERNATGFAQFASNAQCLERSETSISSQPKYRPINGYGNNRLHPTWGTPYTPFGRFGPKNYEDGVSSIKRSVTGSELPNPRKLVLDVLLKAEKTQRTSKATNVLFILNELYISHDMAHQMPVEAFDNCKDIRCCSSGNKKALDPSVSNSACLPISVGQDDPFYGEAGIGCLNMIRSESASSPTTIQNGEILNRVTSYLDHSIIYGSNEAETNKIRSFIKGKLFLGKNNVLPVDASGKFTKVSDRLTSVPISSVLAVLIARNHNSLAESLSKLNNKWNDEKLFQEARRLNIALYQQNVFQKLFIAALGVGLSGTYNAEVNPEAQLEFVTGAYRFFHVYMNSWLSFYDKDNKNKRIPLSETFGRIDLIQDRFDDALRGVLNDKMNFGTHSEEMYNKFAKDTNGVGMDVISIDIQRSRDHGLPNYLDTRKQCGLKSDFKTFEDLLEIFPQSYINLLKNAYEDVRDIDMYVGGSLETFLEFDKVFVGPTFICTIFAQFTNLIAGDAYYFSHTNSPYPFTTAQLAAINTYDFHNLICVNSGLSSIARNWILPSDPIDNPLIPCSNYPQVNLTAWKDI